MCGQILVLDLTMMISFPSLAADDEADPDCSSSVPAETQADDEGTASARNAEGTDAIGLGFACGIPVDNAPDPRNVTDPLAVFASAPGLGLSSKRAFHQQQESQVRCLSKCRTVAAPLFYYHRRWTFHIRCGVAGHGGRCHITRSCRSSSTKSALLGPLQHGHWRLLSTVPVFSYSATV